MGDAHGALRAMEQVLDRAGFDPAADRLIFLGDVADGWPDTRGCVDLLLSIPDRVCLVGNHDVWVRSWLRGTWTTAWDMKLWTSQGGSETLRSYGIESPFPLVAPDDFPDSHRGYFESMVPYHEQDGRVFVHAGFPPDPGPGGVSEEYLTWDRGLWEEAWSRQTRWDGWGRDAGRPAPSMDTGYDLVFLGHTSTARYSDEPVRACEVWNLDQGAGWAGRLSLMDAETEEWWSSDPVATLYPDAPGRFR